MKRRGRSAPSALPLSGFRFGATSEHLTTVRQTPALDEKRAKGG